MNALKSRNAVHLNAILIVLPVITRPQFAAAVVQFVAVAVIDLNAVGGSENEAV